MSVLSGVVKKSLPFLKFNVEHTVFLPSFFCAVSLIGSLLKELNVVPNSYFSNSRNLLNVYFVKVSWGWNLVLLLPFIFLSTYDNKNRNQIVAKRLISLVVATAIWLFCTQIFFYIEDVRGACYESHDMQAIQEGFGTKAECKSAGHFWDGFDISGHSFILSYSTLLIVEEMVLMPQEMNSAVQQSRIRTIILDVLYLALNAIAILWMWMFVCTSVYFHNMIHKILGTLFGVGCWLLTYKFWYRWYYSPGLPPCQKPTKQHD